MGGFLAVHAQDFFNPADPAFFDLFHDRGKFGFQGDYLYVDWNATFAICSSMLCPSSSRRLNFTFP